MTNSPFATLDGDSELVVHSPSSAAGRVGAPATAASPSAQGVLRHVSTRGEVSVVVHDRRGADDVLIVSPDGRTRLPTRGEVTHPALGDGGAVAWVLDLQHLVVGNLASDRQLSLEPPPWITAVHSPVFWDGHGLVVVGQEPVTGEPAEFESLSNLWLIDVTGETWTRVTEFDVVQGATSVVRTPTVDADGSLRFVVVSSSTSEPDVLALHHWRLASPSSGETQVSPEVAGWAFPAGLAGSTLMWNQWDETINNWRIGPAGPGGTITGTVCGRTHVDDPGGIDPDLMPAPGTAQQPLPDLPTSSAPVGLDLRAAVVVGDFATPAAAEQTTARLLEHFDAFTISHDDAPNAVAPGAWAVAWVLEPDTDPEVALNELRRAFPDLESMSWVTNL